jgi:spore coat polysaccharide biosynthesis protein SpsF
MLKRFLERVAMARSVEHIVVATTTESIDDPLATWCRQAGYDVFRGHPTDLLDRHLNAGLSSGADAVVKIPSDCPLIDPAVIDTVLGQWKTQRSLVDYMGNLHPASWPDGNDVEVFSMEILEQAWKMARQPFQREHTTPWMWDGNPNVRTANVSWKSGVDLSMTHRWTLDYPEDYMFVRAVYDALYPSNPKFGVEDILALCDAHPEIEALNAHLAGVNWYRNHLDELRTVGASETRHHPSISAA